MPPLIIPKIIGHRGGAKAYAPENTLASIHTAADMGVEWVEIDVKLTKDHVPIIFHDDDLDRCTNGSGKVAETDFKEIQELDAGSWFGESFIGEKIPTLEEALEVIINRGLGLNLEIKPCAGREIETVEIALDCLTRVWEDDTPPPLISSFSHVSLECAMDIIPEIPRGLLIKEYNEQWKDFAKHLNVSTINIEGNIATEAEIAEYLTFGKPVLAYTINDPRRAKDLIDAGITAVFSDCPDIIMEEIESFH